MITPPALKPGDTIGIVATARKITAEELRPAIAIIEGWGFRVKLGNSIGLEDRQFAGTDSQRATDLQAMLDDDSIQAVLCARGGYGTVRIVDQLDLTKFADRPKWIAGYSDITVLHAHINMNLGIETLHASMPISFPTNTPGALESIRQVLLGDALEYTLDYSELNRLGDTTGVLVGGNLSVLYSISGSLSDIDTDGKILFLEDLDEYLYHVDRMMMQLKRSGKLGSLAGLVIGGMSDMNDNTIPFGKTAIEIIREAVDEFDYPVAFNAPAGHINDNRALKLGAQVELQVTENGTKLKFEN